MGVKIGKDYMVWVAAPGGSPTYALLAGQQDGSLDASLAMESSSSKASRFAKNVPGLKSRRISLSFEATLPDTSGYGVVETAHKDGTTVLVQIRKDGTSGADDDKVFAASMYVSSLPVSFPTNGVVTGSVTFDLADDPTTDLTLA